MPFFSLIPLFFISKKAKTHINIYIFLINKFTFAKYTKSRVYTYVMCITVLASLVQGRVVNKF